MFPIAKKGWGKKNHHHGHPEVIYLMQSKKIMKYLKAEFDANDKTSNQGHQDDFDAS